MIGIGRTVKGSASAIEYLQNDKGHAIEIDRNLLVSDNPTELFWEMQQIHEKNEYCKNCTFSAVLSPDHEQAKNMTKADWRQLTQDFVQKMNLQDNQYIATLHTSTDTPHLHIIANRLDLDGKNMITAHNIHLQIKDAVKELSLERGWKLAEEVKHEQTAELKNTIKAELKECISKSRNLDELAQKMDEKGFKLHYNIRDDKLIGLRITEKGEPSFSSSREGAKPQSNGFKLSEIDRKFKVAEISRELEKNRELEKIKNLEKAKTLENINKNNKQKGRGM